MQVYQETEFVAFNLLYTSICSFALFRSSFFGGCTNKGWLLIVFFHIYQFLLRFYALYSIDTVHIHTVSVCQKGIFESMFSFILLLAAITIIPISHLFFITLILFLCKKHSTLSECLCTNRWGASWTATTTKVAIFRKIVFRSEDFRNAVSIAVYSSTTRMMLFKDFLQISFKVFLAISKVFMDNNAP